jgi:hypothetical protein
LRQRAVLGATQKLTPNVLRFNLTVVHKESAKPS